MRSIIMRVPISWVLFEKNVHRHTHTHMHAGCFRDSLSFQSSSFPFSFVWHSWLGVCSGAVAITQIYFSSIVAICIDAYALLASVSFGWYGRCYYLPLLCHFIHYARFVLVHTLCICIAYTYVYVPSHIQHALLINKYYRDTNRSPSHHTTIIKICNLHANSDLLAFVLFFLAVFRQIEKCVQRCLHRTGCISHLEGLSKVGLGAAGNDAWSSASPY